MFIGWKGKAERKTIKLVYRRLTPPEERALAWDAALGDT